MIRRAGPEDMAAVLEIRRVVFIIGQNVPENIERDELDSDAIHLIALHEGQPVGTARIVVGDGYGKIGRVAVLDAVRGLGLGKAIMRAAADVLRDEGLREARLAAQTHALTFYEALGYEPYGPEFMDAGIPHRDMKMEL
jgi:ElaA protein